LSRRRTFLCKVWKLIADSLEIFFSKSDFKRKFWKHTEYFRVPRTSKLPELGVPNGTTRITVLIVTFYPLCYSNSDNNFKCNCILCGSCSQPPLLRNKHKIKIVTYQQLGISFTTFSKSQTSSTL
jgi:hypothetical protein